MRALLLLLALVFAAPVFGQTGKPGVILETVADAMARKAREGEEISIRHRSTNILWSAPRAFTAFLRSAVTNDHDGVHYITNSRPDAASVYVSQDRNENRQDPRWFGAGPDDGLDDIEALDAASMFGYLNGGRTLAFASGVYDVSRTLKLMPRVNLEGPGVNFASVRTDTNYTALGNGVIRLMAESNVPLLSNHPDYGQLYQPDEVMFDGSTNQSRLYQLSVKGLVFHANGDNQTAGPADAIHLDSVWGIDIEGCAFMRPRGYVGRFRNANAVNVRNCTFGGSLTRSKGLLIEAVADVRWSDVTVFQTAGPGYNFVASAYGHYVNLYQFGSVFPGVLAQRWNTNALTANLTNNIIFVEQGMPLERGDAVWFSSTSGNVHGVSDFTTYYAYPLSSNTFTVNRNYRLATNGVATTLTPLYTGAGYFEVGIGHDVGAMLTESLILGIHSLHVDENLDGGVAFWNASDNQIVGLSSHRNAGTPGSSYATNVTSAVTFRGASRRNIISAPTVRDATNAISFEYNAGDNRIIGLSPNLVRTNFVTVAGGEQSWYDAVRDVRTKTLWLDTDDASPSWRALRSGSSTIDFAVGGTSSEPQWFMRDATAGADMISVSRLSDVNALSIGGNTYTSANTNHPAVLSGSAPSGGHISGAPAKSLTFVPSLGTGTNDFGGGLFRWMLPLVNTNLAATTIHETSEGMLLSLTNLIVVPPVFSIGPSSGDRGTLQYVASSDTLRMIAPSTLEFWAGPADREMFITSAGLMMDTGKSITLGGVTRTTWPTGFSFSDLTNSLLMGANMSAVYTSTNMTISSSGGGGGATNGTAITVDSGVFLSTLNIGDTARVGATLTGTNLTFDIVGGSITTNELAPAAISYLTSWSSFTGTPTTLSGYGITDAQPLDADLTRIANVSWSLGDMLWHDGTGLTNLVTTAAGRALMAAADAAAQRVLLTVTNYQAGNGIQLVGTNFSHNLEAGANITFTTNSGALVITGAGGGGGSSVSVDGTAITGPNWISSADITNVITGVTNIAPTIRSASITTNKIDATFYSWVESMATGGGGSTSTISNIMQRVGYAEFEIVTDGNDLGSGWLTSVQSVTVGGVLTTVYTSSATTNAFLSPPFPDTRSVYDIRVNVAASGGISSDSVFVVTDRILQTTNVIKTINTNSAWGDTKLSIIQPSVVSTNIPLLINSQSGSGEVALGDLNPGIHLWTNRFRLDVFAITNLTVGGGSGSGGGTTNLVSSSAAGLAPQATLANAVLGTDGSTNVAWESKWMPIVTESGTTLSLTTATHANSYVRLTSGSSCTITVTASTNQAWTVGTEIVFRVAAAGIPTIGVQGGVTVNGTNFVSSLAQHGTFGLKLVATDVWDCL